MKQILSSCNTLASLAEHFGQTLSQQSSNLARHAKSGAIIPYCRLAYFHDSSSDSFRAKRSAYEGASTEKLQRENNVMLGLLCAVFLDTC